MNIILATIFAHMISDFIIQSDKTVEEKSKLKLKGLLKHFFEVFIPLFVILQIQFDFIDVILYSIAMSFVHIIIDAAKALIQRKNSDRLGTGMFLADQLLHMASIISAVVLLNIEFFNNSFFSSAALVFKNTSLSTSQAGIQLFIAKAELYGIVYLLFGVGAGVFIGNFIKQFKPQDQEEKPLKAGKYIGIFERLVIITLTILSQFSAIAFIVAAKSLARHEDLNKRGFAEYYLLGTLLSIFTAITGGLLLNRLIPLIQ